MSEQLSAAASLEYPIVLVACGLGATEAVLEELDPSGDCRLRSLRFFSPGTKMQFAFGPRDGAKRHVYGRIAGYTTREKRFVYHVELDEMLSHQSDRIAGIVAERRRELAVGQIVEVVADTNADPPLARASIRAEANFDLEYCRVDKWRHAKAANLSTGGLLMRAHETLVEGMALSMRFTLPSTVLERCSQRLSAEKRLHPQILHAAQSMLRRPFKPLSVRARIVCHRPIAGVICDYGMEFCETEQLTRGEIERYVTALHFAEKGRMLVPELRQTG